MNKAIPTSHRARAIMSSAVQCEALERRMLLSLAPAGAEFRANTFTTNAQDMPAIASDADGDFVVVWRGSGIGDGVGVFAQRYNAAGGAQGGEFRVNTTTTPAQADPSVAMDADGDFVVAWESTVQDGSGAGIYAQRFNASGVSQGSEFRVNTFTSSDQLDPSVAMDASGNFVIAWMSLGQEAANDRGIYAQRYDALGVPQGGELHVNTTTAGNQRNPVATMDASGDFIITWKHDADSRIYAQRYNAFGATVGGEFPLTGIVNQHALAMDADGDFVLAWDLPDGSGQGVFARRYNAAGVAQGSEFRVNTFTTNSQDGAAVAMDADGDFLITWSSDLQDGSGRGVYGQSFDAGGAPEGDEFRVNTFTTGAQRLPVVAMNADGDAVVAWQSLQDGSGYGVYAQRYTESDPDTAPPMVADIVVGGKRVMPYASQLGPVSQILLSFSENVSDAGGPSGVNSVTNPANWLLTRNGIAVAPTITYGFNPAANRFEALVTLPQSFADGNFLLKARDNIRDIAGNRLDGNLDGVGGGSMLLPFGVGIIALGGEFRVNTVTLFDQRLPGVAMDQTGNFVVVWEHETNPDTDRNILAQRYNAAGVPQGVEFAVAASASIDQRYPTVASDADGDFVVVWASNPQDGSGEGVYARRYNAAGVAQGAEFRVNTFVGGNQTSPDVAMDPAGNFVVAWQSNLQDGSDYGVYAQRFNAAGTVQGSEFRVNTFTTGNQSFPSIAIDASGDFIVAWHSFGQDGGDFGIYAQRYNANGVAQGSEFRVNTTTVEDQVRPVVAMDSDGDFVVVWDDHFNSFAQRFNAAGVPQGQEFRINPVVVGGSVNPDVAMDADGDFVVAWFDYGNPVQYDVLARRYNAAGLPLGDPFPVNTFTTSRQNSPAVAMNADGEFVVAWASFGQDGSEFGVYAQRYGARATPTVAALDDVPDPVTSGNSITLSAGGVTSLDGTVTSVSFYRESNAEPGLQVGVEGDTLVGTSTNPVGGFWSASASTAGLPGGTYTYFAQATDDVGLTGIPASTTNTVIGTAPAVNTSSFVFETAPHRLRFTFNDNVSASLGTNDLVLENLTTLQTIPSNHFSLSYDTGTNTATFSYTGNAGGFSGVLPDGNYRATLTAAGITNPGGTPMAANHVFDFFFLNGDANRDGAVNLADFNILAANFGQSPRNFTQGDFNYDGIVNLADFNILAARFGQALPAVTFGRNEIGAADSADSDRELLEELS